MYGVSELQYAFFWVIAAGFGLAFLAVMVYYLVRKK